MECVRIISDGTAEGTKLLNHDGVEIPGVASIEIKPIKNGGIVEAVVWFGPVEMDLDIKPAEDFEDVYIDKIGEIYGLTKTRG